MGVLVSVIFLKANDLVIWYLHHLSIKVIRRLGLVERFIRKEVAQFPEVDNFILGSIVASSLFLIIAHLSFS